MTFASKTTAANDVQSSNMFIVGSPWTIASTSLCAFLNIKSPENWPTLTSISLTEDAFEKAPLPIVTGVLGNYTAFTDEQFANASSPIKSSVSGNAKFCS